MYILHRLCLTRNVIRCISRSSLYKFFVRLSSNVAASTLVSRSRELTPYLKPRFRVKILLLLRISDLCSRHGSTVLIMAALCNRGPIYFCPLISIFFMVALCNRETIYIFILFMVALCNRSDHYIFYGRPM